MASLAIPLQVNSPQPASPLQTIGGLIGLRGQMSEMALRQAQTEQARQQQQLIAVEQQQKNRDLADQNALGAKMNDPAFTGEFYAGGERTQKALAGLNLQGKTIENAVTHVNDTIAKQALIDKDTLGNQAAASAQLEKIGQNILQGDSEGKPADLDTANSRWQSASPEIARLAKLAGIKNQLPGTFGSLDEVQNGLASIRALTSAKEAALAQKKTQAETAASLAQADKAKADADQAIAQAANLRATLPKAEADARVAKLEADFAATHGGIKPAEAETQRHNKAEEAVHQGELGIKEKTFNATLGSGLDVNGQPLSPEAMKAAAMQDPTALAIAHYQIAPPPAQTRGGVPSPILRKVLAINPQYDATTYPARAETAKGFSPSGQQGQAITAADTALAHLNTLSAAGKALDNGDIQVINRVANAIGAQVGATPKATYDTILNMVGPEISKAVIGAVGGEGERAGTAANFTSNLSPAQRESNIAAAVGLLGARFDKASHAYESQMGVPLPRTLSPESQAIRAHYSGASSAVQPIALKDGTFLTPHDAAAADRFRKDHPELLK